MANGGNHVLQPLEAAWWCSCLKGPGMGVKRSEVDPSLNLTYGNKLPGIEGGEESLRKRQMNKKGS